MLFSNAGDFWNTWFWQQACFQDYGEVESQIAAHLPQRIQIHAKTAWMFHSL